VKFDKSLLKANPIESNQKTRKKEEEKISLKRGGKPSKLGQSF
jgi:hypothetical protein